MSSQVSIFPISPLNFPAFLQFTLRGEGWAELSARENEHNGLLACSSCSGMWSGLLGPL